MVKNKIINNSNLNLTNNKSKEMLMLSNNLMYLTILIKHLIKMRIKELK